MKIKKITALLLAAAVLWTGIPVRAAEDRQRIADAEAGRIFKMLTTGYCYGTVTASGTAPREGICAVRPEWMGKTALVWECREDGTQGDFLGYWECLDTGFGADSDGDGIGSIQEGKVIDMYFPTPEQVTEWMELTGGQVYIQLIDAEG
ncbi:MAG: hypothetical protein NC548_33340 [Lachnospiraceae bacterium]|nr:hypothetical protein [Lachnospiraceae bacterium]